MGDRLDLRVCGRAVVTFVAALALFIVQLGASVHAIEFGDEPHELHEHYEFSKHLEAHKDHDHHEHDGVVCGFSAATALDDDDAVAPPALILARDNRTVPSECVAEQTIAKQKVIRSFAPRAPPAL